MRRVAVGTSSFVDTRDAHRAGRGLGAIQGAQHCADEGAAIANGRDADLDLAVRCQSIQGILNPPDRYELPGRTSRGRHPHRIAFDSEHSVRTTRERADLLPNEPFEYATSVVVP